MVLTTFYFPDFIHSRVSISFLVAFSRFLRNHVLQFFSLFFFFTLFISLSLRFSFSPLFLILLSLFSIPLFFLISFFFLQVATATPLHFTPYVSSNNSNNSSSSSKDSNSNSNSLENKNEKKRNADGEPKVWKKSNYYLLIWILVFFSRNNNFDFDSDCDE